MIQVYVLAGQRDDHQRRAAQRRNLGPVFSLPGLGESRSLVQDPPQGRRLFGALQDQERATLAETRRRRTVSRSQQPFGDARSEGLAGEAADHLAALDDFAKFHAASVERLSQKVTLVKGRDD
jgi:hypothetical protein